MIMMIYKLEDHQKNSTGLEPGNRQDIAVNSTHNAKLVISHSLCLLFEEYIGQGWKISSSWLEHEMKTLLVPLTHLWLLSLSPTHRERNTWTPIHPLTHTNLWPHPLVSGQTPEGSPFHPAHSPGRRSSRSRGSSSAQSPPGTWWSPCETGHWSVSYYGYILNYILSSRVSGRTDMVESVCRPMKFVTKWVHIGWTHCQDTHQSH